MNDTVGGKFKDDFKKKIKEIKWKKKSLYVTNEKTNLQMDIK